MPLDDHRPLRIVDDDRYLDFEQVAKGGMGVVYLALDSELNRRVALKIVRPDRAAMESDPATGPLSLIPPSTETPDSSNFRTLTARFLQEAWVTGGLEHPGIVPVYELGQTPAGVPYYTMRFVKGERTLETAIDEGDGFLDRQGLIESFLRICDTMAYAHSRGVVHRDLKPANVALGEFGEVIVLDWGLAKARDEGDADERAWLARIEDLRAATDLETVEGALGTPGFMAPEALLGDIENVDEKSDVYSLGVILYRILTGRLPHEFKTIMELFGRCLDEEPTPPDELDPAVSPELAAICLAALSSEREKRIPSPRELARRVREWQRESVVDREVEALLREAEGAFAATEGLKGEELLRQSERVGAAARRVLELRPENERAMEMAEECRSLRRFAMEERARRTRKRLLAVVGVASLLVAFLAAGLFAYVLEGRRKELLAERDATAAALLRARALALTNASARAAEEDPMRALLLAREAARIDRGPAVVKRLRRAIHDSLERRRFDLPPGGSAWVETGPGGRLLAGAGDGIACLIEPDGTVKHLIGHDGIVLHGAFSPKGDRILTCLVDSNSRGVVHIRDGEGNPLGTWRSPAPNLPSSALGYVRFFPDGDRFIAAFRNDIVRFVDIEGMELSDYPETKRIESVPTLTNDGRRLLAGGEVWDLESGTRLPLVSGDTSVLAISGDGTRTATAAGRHTLSIRDEQGKTLARYPLFSTLGSTLEFHPQPDVRVRVALIGGEFAELQVGQTRQDLPDLSAPYRRVEFGGWDYILTTTADRRAQVFGADGSFISELRGHTEEVGDVAFPYWPHPVATAARDATVRLWAVEGSEVGVFRRFVPIDGVPYTTGHGIFHGIGKVPISDVAFAPDGRGVLLGIEGESAAFRWMPGSDEEPPILIVPGDVSTDIETTPGRTTIGVVRTIRRESASRVFLRDLATGSRQVELVGHQGRVYGMAISPIGDRALTFGVDRTGRIWNFEGKQLAALTGHESAVTCGAFSPDGRLIATGSWITSERTARIWDSDGNQVAILEGHRDGIDTVRFSPDGRTVLTASRDGTARLWSIDGEQLAVLRGHEEALRSAMFTADGRRILTASQDRTARLWDLDGNEIVRFTGHEKAVYGAVFSPDEERILTCSHDGTARIWNLAGEELDLLSGHDGPVWTATWSADGRRILTHGADDAVRVWFANVEDLIDLADERVTRDFSPTEARLFAELLPDRAGEAAPVERGTPALMEYLAAAEPPHGLVEKAFEELVDALRGGRDEELARLLEFEDSDRALRYLALLWEAQDRVMLPSGVEARIRRGLESDDDRVLIATLLFQREFDAEAGEVAARLLRADGPSHREMAAAWLTQEEILRGLLVSPGDALVPRIAPDREPLTPELATALLELLETARLRNWSAASLTRAVVLFSRIARPVERRWARVLNSTAESLDRRERPVEGAGGLAVVLAELAVEASGREDPGYLETLALAFATVGRVTEAIATQEEGIALTEPGSGLRERMGRVLEWLRSLETE